MLKKFALGLCSLALCTFIIGCGGGQPADSAAPAEPAAEAPAEDGAAEAPAEEAAPAEAEGEAK